MYAQARTLGTTAPSFVPAWPLPLRCGGGCGQSSEPWARDFPLGDAVDGVEAGRPPDAVEAAVVHAVGAHHARAAILHHRLARHLARHRSSLESRTQSQARTSLEGTRASLMVASFTSGLDGFGRTRHALG